MGLGLEKLFSWGKRPRLSPFEKERKRYGNSLSSSKKRAWAYRYLRCKGHYPPSSRLNRDYGGICSTKIRRLIECCIKKASLPLANWVWASAFASVCATNSNAFYSRYQISWKTWYLSHEDSNVLFCCQIKFRSYFSRPRRFHGDNSSLLFPLYWEFFQKIFVYQRDKYHLVFDNAYFAIYNPSKSIQMISIE